MAGGQGGNMEPVAGPRQKAVSLLRAAGFAFWSGFVLTTGAIKMVLGLVAIVLLLAAAVLFCAASSLLAPRAKTAA